jgi:hypothetical protein
MILARIILARHKPGGGTWVLTASRREFSPLTLVSEARMVSSLTAIPFPCRYNALKNVFFSIIEFSDLVLKIEFKDKLLI